MKNSYTLQLSPLQVGTHLYKNRLVAAPIYCGPFALLPSLADVLSQSVREKAAGGCAQVTVGETPVDYQLGSREPFPPIGYENLDDPAIEPLRCLTEIVHAHDAVAMIELSHCGNSKLAAAGAGDAIGPVGFLREDGVRVQAMDETMMQAVCEQFVTAARFMRHAGFDGVMIHAGHGWLLHQFLSARTNTRTDAYGGSLENRARFPLQLIRAVRTAMGDDFLLEVRVSGDECCQDGMEVEEVAAFCAMAEPYVDLFHVSVGLYREPVRSGQFSSLFAPHALNAALAAVVKQAVRKPVAVVGGINSAALAEGLLADGSCDLVAMARQLTADPDFARKVEQGRGDDIAPCLRCFKCFPGPLEDNLDNLSDLFGCTVNPKAFLFDPAVSETTAAESKHVLVIGGGIAGMEAAVVAHDRGHRVTLVEKSHTLGGLLTFSDSDFFKTDLRDFKDLLIRRVKEREIRVLLDTACTPENIGTFAADAVIVAVGSVPLSPPIPGIEHALPALVAYSDLERVGQNVVIVGGGLVGCEAGLNLAQTGRTVTIVEMADSVAPDAYPMHRVGLLDKMEEVLSFSTGLRCTAMRADGITVQKGDGEPYEIPADTVIYALGMRSLSEQAQALCAAAGVPSTVIGDCVRPAKVYDAMREAYVAATAL